MFRAVVKVTEVPPAFTRDAGLETRNVDRFEWIVPENI
jgi:hypothetical protein